SEASCTSSSDRCPPTAFPPWSPWASTSGSTTATNDSQLGWTCWLLGWKTPATPPTDRRPSDGPPREDVNPHSRPPTGTYKGGEPDEHWRSLRVLRSGAAAWAAGPAQRRLPLSVLRVRVRACL